MQYRDFFYILLGYLAGSILFARLFGKLMCHRDVTAEGADHNPGTANAFRYGGIWCGVLTLCGDLLKGYLPVRLYLKGLSASAWEYALALVIAAPVLGHILPFFHILWFLHSLEQVRREGQSRCVRWDSLWGGKGIAVSFGCLLGLSIQPRPLLILAGLFLLFSLVIRISPHYYRTMAVYGLSAALVAASGCEAAVILGFLLIAGLIIGRLLASTEEKEAFQVEVVWRH